MVAEAKVWVGVDSGVKASAVCITDDGGNVLEQRMLSSKAALIHDLISGTCPTQSITIAMESCSTSMPLTKALRRLGYKVVVYDAFQIRRFAEIRKNKTDTNDARSIAEVARLGHQFLTEVHIKSNECFALRSKLVLRHNFVRQRIRTEQLMRSNFRLHGGRLGARPTRIATFQKMVENEIAAVAAETGADIADGINALMGVAIGLRMEIDRLDREIADFANGHPVCKLLTTIPAVSAITAVSFYTAIEDRHRFSRATDVAAYFGLTPKILQSGDTTKVRGISKAGNVLTRTHLVTAATVLLTVVKKDSELRTWGTGRVGAIGLPKARIAVARKLAILMFTLWRDGRSFEPFPSAIKNPDEALAA